MLASIDDAVAGLTSACPCRLPYATAPSFALSPNILPRTSFPKDIYIRMFFCPVLPGAVVLARDLRMVAAIRVWRMGLRRRRRVGILYSFFTLH